MRHERGRFDNKRFSSNKLEKHYVWMFSDKMTGLEILSKATYSQAQKEDALRLLNASYKNCTTRYNYACFDLEDKKITEKEFEKIKRGIFRALESIQYIRNAVNSVEFIAR